MYLLRPIGPAKIGDLNVKWNYEFSQASFL